MPVTKVVMVTVQEADLPLPSFAVAVIVQVPFATPVTKPLLLTVATLVSLLDHVTDVSLAFDGDAVAANWAVVPTTIVFVL